jgi:hypothetical protein
MSSTEKQNRRTEALEWVGRQLRYESFLADLRVRAGAGHDTASEHVTSISGRAGRAATDEARDTAAA